MNSYEISISIIQKKSARLSSLSNELARAYEHHEDSECIRISNLIGNEIAELYPYRDFYKEKIVR